MRRIICLLPVLAILFVFSCTKTDINPTTPPPPPPATDSFFSWQLMQNTLKSPLVEDIWFVSPAKGYFAGSDNTIYISQDSGKSWIQNAGSNLTTELLNLFFLDAQYGFAESNSQLMITRDGGSHWVVKPLPTTKAINMVFVNPATGFYGDAANGLYKTTDTGTTWNLVYSNISLGVFPWFSTGGLGYVFTGAGAFSRTSDTGSTWQPVATLSLTSQIIAFNSLQFVDSLNGYFASSGGILKTIDGGKTWTAVYSPGSNVNLIKFFDANTGYYADGGTIYKTINGGQTWSTSCKLKSDAFTGMHFISPTTGWACTGGGYILRINQ